ncbi:uncharacterized protein A1O9_01979 [Exophiala aquamarina CBS 119918]|uniref:Nephrocystin 3-like N-terminal domain-containing protein n=1 Tax=Exophiala aquamarina CBS 119918 TaxID=1182545 RepID=A0A072PM54_9EURO|nr:uncharacterized protein A1O9_01979 [Exophiala aquamarina CBS 119918]KEF60418.1 hypothetical protein A1O9_01979 [Exophiala aquamarina CBS 119918]
MSMQNDFAGTFDSAGPQILSSQINATTVNFGQSASTTKDKKAILLESLKYKNINTRWSSIREEHVHTCRWLFEETEFQDWLTHRKAHENHGFLWIKGKPGSGKSTLMKYACLATRKEMKGKGFTIVSFFFNARGALLEKSTAGLYRSLLWQLLKSQSLDFISQILDDVMLDDFLSETFSWTLESLESLFRVVIKELRLPVICFIDALGECDESQVRQMGKKPKVVKPALCDERHYPFVRYAADNVLFHAETAAASHIPEERFLAEFDFPVWIALHNTYLDVKARQHTAKTRLLYALAEVNVPNLLKSCSMKYSYLDIDEERFGTPLHVALAAGSVDAVKTFLDLRVEGLAAEHPARNYLRKYSLECTKRTKTHWGVAFQRQSNFLFHLIECEEEAVFAIFLCTASPQELLEYVSDIDKSGRTLLIAAATRGLFKAVELLVQQPGIKLNAQDHSFMSALHYAADAGHAQIVQLLLEKDETDVNVGDHSLETPTKLAIKGQQLEVVRILLALRPGELKLHATGYKTGDAYDKAFLSYAVEAGSKEVIQILLETHQEEVYLRDSSGRNPLSYAAQWGLATGVEVLLKTYQVDVNSKDKHGRIPLAYAAQSNSKEVIQAFLKDPQVEVNSRDENGRTPLSYAAEWNSEGAMKALLETHQVQVDSRDMQGRTPFSWAASSIFGRRDGVWANLMNIGHADPAIKDNDSRSPLWYAVSQYDDGQVDFLLQTTGVNSNSRDIHGISPLQVAAHCERQKTVVDLLDNDEIEIRDGDWIDPAAELFPCIYPFILFKMETSESRLCFQLIRDEWLARQAVLSKKNEAQKEQTKEDQAKTDTSRTRVSRARKRALSVKSDALSVRSSKR